MSTIIRFVIPEAQHNDWIAQVYQHRGYAPEEAACAAKWCGLASRHGIKTHAALKALHLEHIFGRERKLCTPKAEMQVLPGRFDAVVRVDARHKLGQPVAEWAMNTACELADRHGVGVVTVDNAFHYLWGGGYVMEAARKGYIAYTNCTSTLAEVVPFRGKTPTLGTNPHSWAFPTTHLVGFPVVMDFATSSVAMGKVQVYAREGKMLESLDQAVDKDGKPTQDPKAVGALLPMGGATAGHKGYMLGLLIELYGAYSGGFLPTVRGLGQTGPSAGQKRSGSFFFQAIHPEALASADFADAPARDANVKAVVDDILGHGNRENGSLLPGELEAKAAKESERAGGLIFTSAEIAEFKTVLAEAGITLEESKLKTL